MRLGVFCKIILVLCLVGLLRLAAFWLILIWVAYKVVRALLSLFSEPPTPEEIVKNHEEKRLRELRGEADHFCELYRKANFIPKSRWILMNRYEKSKIHEIRETMTDRFNSLAGEAQDMVLADLGCDPRKNNNN